MSATVVCLTHVTTKPLISFHGDCDIKAKYLARVRRHAREDEIVKGRYWEDGKGCAVGCTIHSEDHGTYETDIGLPKWLAHLEDRLFESLPNDYAKKFPEVFLETIPIGVNLERVRWQFLSFVLGRQLVLAEKIKIDGDVKKQFLTVVQEIKDAHDAAIATCIWSGVHPETAAKAALMSAHLEAVVSWTAPASASLVGKMAFVAHAAVRDEGESRWTSQAAVVALEMEVTHATATKQSQEKSVIQYADKLLELLAAAI